MPNVVILYTGNVCSTPMIEYARLCKDIFVPVREHLDYHRFLEVSPTEGQVGTEIAKVLDDLFNRVDTPFMQQDGLVKWSHGQPVPSTEQQPHMLFKWRSFPTNHPDSDSIAEVFCKNAAIPLIMLRKSLSHQALKIYLSEKIYGGRHQQFKTRSMDDKAYTAYLKDQEAILVSATDVDIAQIIDIAERFLIRTLRTIEGAKFFFPNHAPPHVLFAEHIFTPLINLDRYNRALVTLLGDVAPLVLQQEVALRKAGLEIYHCANAEEVFRDPKLVDLERQYQAAATGLHNIFQDA